MQTVFLVLSVVSAAALSGLMIAGYCRSLREKPSPRCFFPLKLIFLIAFCVCWFLWNLARNFA